MRRAPRLVEARAGGVRPSARTAAGASSFSGGGFGALADGAQEQLVQAPLARDLRVERDDEQVALARRDRMAVDGGEDLDVVTRLVDPGRADEDGADGRSFDAGDAEIGLEGADLAPERVAAAGVVRQAEVLAVEHDHPRAGAEYRRPRVDEVAE